MLTICLFTESNEPSEFGGSDVERARRGVGRFILESRNSRALGRSCPRTTKHASLRSSFAHGGGKRYDANSSRSALALSDRARRSLQ